MQKRIEIDEIDVEDTKAKSSNKKDKKVKNKETKAAKKAARRMGLAGYAAGVLSAAAVGLYAYGNLSTEKENYTGAAIETSIDGDNDKDFGEDDKYTYNDIREIVEEKEALVKTIDEKLENVDESTHFTPSKESRWKERTLNDGDILRAEKDYVNEEIGIFNDILSQEALDDDEYLSDEAAKTIDDYFDIAANGEITVQIERADVEAARKNTIQTVKSFMEEGEGVTVDYNTLDKIYGTPSVYVIFKNEAAFIDSIYNPADEYLLYIEEEHDSQIEKGLFDEIDHEQNAIKKISGQAGTVNRTTNASESVKVNSTKTVVNKTPAPVVTPEKEPDVTPEYIPDPDPTPITPETPDVTTEDVVGDKKPAPNAEDHQGMPAPGEEVGDTQGMSSPAAPATEDVGDTQGMPSPEDIASLSDDDLDDIFGYDGTNDEAQPEFFMD